MKRVKNRSLVLLFIILVPALMGAAWLLFGDLFSNKARDDSAKNSGFAEALHLEGTWIRPDGGYKLVIEDVRPDGSLKTSYFNPSRINVYKAYWEFRGNRPYLFIELRDINYPGSKYNLLYYKERDLLAGVYFQAVENQTFEIAFTKNN